MDKALSTQTARGNQVYINPLLVAVPTQRRLDVYHYSKRIYRNYLTEINPFA